MDTKTNSNSDSNAPRPAETGRIRIMPVGRVRIMPIGSAASGAKDKVGRIIYARADSTERKDSATRPTRPTRYDLSEVGHMSVMQTVSFGVQLRRRLTL
jgi:hypothetical protein